MQTPTQGRSPRFRVAKPLKGFAPLRGTMLSPKKWWHWEIAKKPMPPKPYEGRSDLILGGLLTTAPAFLIENHIHYLFRLSWYLARRCPAMIPDMQTRTSQCVSVIANRLSCFLQDGSRPWHRLYGTQPACKSWTATDLQVHVLRICKYDYNPKFGKLQDGREKWVESPNLHPIMRFSVV